MNEVLSQKLEALPESPGVYLMKDAKGRVIYVGKALSLKHRVRSYYNRTGDGRFFIHLLAVVTCYARYGSAQWMVESPDLAHYPASPPPGWGYPLPVVYLVWAIVEIAMYLPCRWFAEVKQRNHSPCLSDL